MKTKLWIPTFLLLLAFSQSQAQEVQTLFKSTRPSGGYAALSNKFTTIKGEYANMAELYGGWFIKRRFLLGIGAAATTNSIKVPYQYSTAPLLNMNWEYGQFGLMTEYVFGSNRVVHLNLNLFSGAGFTVQYERRDWDEWDTPDYEYDDVEHDENFFYVIEPGAQLELNVFKWMRLSPGISYRKTFGSDGIGLNDNDLSNWSYNISLKFGKF
jgi:hypothetical protein